MEPDPLKREIPDGVFLEATEEAAAGADAVTTPPAAPYISADMVRQVLPSTATPAVLSREIIERWVREAAARVRRKTGVEVLPEGDEEVEGIVRDLAAARAYALLFGGQSKGDVPIAQALRKDALDALRDLDLSASLEGEGSEGGGGSERPVLPPERSVANLDAGPLWGPADAFNGYQYPGFYRGP